MMHLRPTLCAVLACLLLALPVAAQSPLDERLDMDLEQADVPQVLRAFGSILRLNSDRVVVDPAISGELTLTLQGVRLETLLTAVCESAGCTWQFDGDRLVFDQAPGAPDSRATRKYAATGTADPSLDEPIDMALKDAPLSDILHAFASITQTDLEIDPAVDGDTPVTIELRDTPAHTALDTICRRHGCTWSFEERDGRRSLRIEPRR